MEYSEIYDKCDEYMTSTKKAVETEERLPLLPLETTLGTVKKDPEKQAYLNDSS